MLSSFLRLLDNLCRRMGISTRIVARAMKALAMAAILSLAYGNQTDATPVGDLAAPPLDRPVGNKATVSPVSAERRLDLSSASLSTYIVDYAPGGSAVLHRHPSSGYVVVHVLSGAITASAWQAGIGIYRAGETWTEPAFAYDIASKNASTREPAKALVILITEDPR